MRARLRDRLGRGERDARRFSEERLHDLVERTRGLAVELEQLIAPPERYVDERTLVDQVRSRLGREMPSLLEHVNLNGVGHTIHLHGTLAPADRERLIETISRIDGVEKVEAEHLRARTDVA